MKMRCNKIEIEGIWTTITICWEDDRNIRVDSIKDCPVKDLAPHTFYQYGKSSTNDDMYKIAKQLQQRDEGGIGTAEDINCYFKLLQDFRDGL